MAASIVPDRGDVVWLSFDPQAGRRPAIVLSPQAYNRRVGLAIVCPITSHAKGYPFEVPLPAGFSIRGVVLADQVKNLDWKSRKCKLIERVPRATIDEVLQKLGALLA